MKRRKRILIIDDDISYLDMARKRLQEKGFAVSIHDRLAEAPVVIRHLEPDVVLLNTNLRGFSENKLNYLMASSTQARNVSVICYSIRNSDCIQTAAEKLEPEIPAAPVDSCALLSAAATVF